MHDNARGVALYIYGVYNNLAIRGIPVENRGNWRLNGSLPIIGLGRGVVGMGQGDSYWDKNKSRSLEGKLERYTKIVGAVYMVIALVLNIIS